MGSRDWAGPHDAAPPPIFFNFSACLRDILIVPVFAVVVVVVVVVFLVV